MKRLSLLGFVGMLASVLAGCPIFDDHRGDTCSFNDCITTGNPGTCSGPGDCFANETCGDDNQCHSGDCTLWGCSPGFQCAKNADQTATCQPGGTGGSGPGGSTSASTSATTGTGGGGPSTYCGNPKDCAAGQTCSTDGTCKAGDCSANGCIYGYTCSSSDGLCHKANPAACQIDAECASLGAGYACVSGVCTQPSDQCFDQTQCAGNDKCVSGKCTPACTTDANCGAGYACNVALGVCSKPGTTCSITNDCGGPNRVCVAGACVPRSSGATCPSGDVWVDNGCIPSQSAQFVCATDGELGMDSTPGLCASGSICLHHACYIACDAAMASNACTNLPTVNQCKSVTTSSGAHDVCGSKQNLGGECGAANPGKECVVGKICIDGFCK